MRRGKTNIDIIPAIDLKNGKCVCLYQGDYAKETIFSDDPVEIALRWQSLGAPRLHIVDLDGAVDGDVVNMAIIREIAGAVQIPIQVGGGIRDMATIEKLLKAGVERTILGTAAVEDPEFVRKACRRFHDAIVVAIDARDGYLATHGWRQETDLTTIDFAHAMALLGVRRFIYTDINRDGTLTEPNFSAIYEMVSGIRQRVIASGGIATLNHLKVLWRLGVEGAIVGKALYTGDINFKQALDAISKMPK
ncbi:MAG: 1-(5-phosphoribosyl)-5-[(5-phosphoribosylamino)methylideneamino]imidazole-4-carboxamide isomerase [Chloroflexota bacterium]